MSPAHPQRQRKLHHFSSLVFVARGGSLGEEGDTPQAAVAAHGGQAYEGRYVTPRSRGRNQSSAPSMPATTMMWLSCNPETDVDYGYLSHEGRQRVRASRSQGL